MLNQLIDYLIINIGSFGYLGIFILMAIESTIFPLPSELVLIPKGVLIARGVTGAMNPILIVLFAALGSVIGALLCYLVSLYLGRKVFESYIGKYGRFIFVKEGTIEAADTYFKKHGEITIFVSRLLPVVRHLISFPAGFSKMKLSRFIIYTFVGAAIWSSVLLYVGYLFGNIENNTGLLTIALVVFCLILIGLYLFIKYRLLKNSK